MMFVILLSKYLLIQFLYLNKSNVLSEVGMLLVVISILTINIVIYGLFQSISGHMQEASESKNANQQYIHMHDYYSEVIRSSKDTRRLWHDMNNHFITIGYQLKQQAYDEASDYVNSICSELDKSMLLHISGYYEIDAMLSHKFKVASEKGIRVEHDIQVSKLESIKMVDMSIISGNALDNAIEACDRVIGNHKFIKIVVHSANSILSINITNSVNIETIRKQGNKFISSKDRDESEIHGYGLYNIGTVVKKYGGNMITEVSNDEFELSMVIPLA
jgi:sensor histidine kinase regulating citrate/malate metabolism